MGTSTNGIIAYGYNLGSGEDEWDGLAGDRGEYGELTIDWYKEGEDFVEQAMNRLRASVGFTETDWRAEGYWDRQRQAEAQIGVEFESYCSGDYPMYLLATKAITVYRGDVELLDLDAMLREPAEHGWDDKLATALTTLGLTPKQKRPAWLLCSYWC